jgi:hypothetical protein
MVDQGNTVDVFHGSMSTKYLARFLLQFECLSPLKLMLKFNCHNNSIKTGPLRGD